MQQTWAQSKAIKCTADPPLIRFSTGLLQSADTAGTNAWIK